LLAQSPAVAFGGDDVNRVECLYCHCLNPSSIVYGPRPAGGGRSGTAASAVGPSVFGAVCVPGLAEVVGSERLGQDHGHRGPSAGHVEDEVVAAVFEQQLSAPSRSYQWCMLAPGSWLTSCAISL